MTKGSTFSSALKTLTTDRSTKITFICLFTAIGSSVGGRRQHPLHSGTLLLPLTATSLTCFEEPCHSGDFLELVQTSKDLKNLIFFLFPVFHWFSDSCHDHVVRPAIWQGLE